MNSEYELHMGNG